MRAAFSLIALGVLSSCASSHRAHVEPDAGASPDAAASCAPGEIWFTQATGCANDGSVEFCIPDGDPALREALSAISSDIGCGIGGGSGCPEPEGMLHCGYRTNRERCTSEHGALTDAAWSDVCAIAALDAVTRITHMFYE